jgi:hypothetical protein
MRRAALWLIGGALCVPLAIAAFARAAKGLEGGVWKRNDVLRSAEIFSPASGRWSASGDLVEPIAGAEAVALASGDALAVTNSPRGLRAQRWSAKGGQWSSAGEIDYISRFRLIALRDGRALVANADTIGAGEVQLLEGNGWRALPSPGHGAVACVAEVAGGVLAVISDPLGKPNTRAALLDLATAKWAEIAAPFETSSCTLTPLADGRALFAFERATVDPADTPLMIFDRRFVMQREKLAANLAGIPSWAERLDDGRVLHLLWLPLRAVLWDPRSGRVSTRELDERTHAPMFARLSGGRLLATGGTIPTGDEHHDLWDPDATAEASIVDLDAGSATPVARMAQARELHSIVRLASGDLLVFGGRGPSGHVVAENALAFFEGALLALAIAAALTGAIRRSSSRVRDLLLFVAGAAIGFTATFLAVLSQFRFPS